MEKERDSKVIAIIALLIAVVGLSVGFAAFTKDLNITFSDSNVNVSGDLDIKFLASADPDDTSTTIEALIYGPGMSGNPATISSDSLTISGMGATFSDKDQAVQYKFYIYNNSEYDAYLKSVDFLNYTGAETNKVCTALEGTTQSLVDAACKDVHVGVSSGNMSTFDTVNDIGSFKISKGTVLEIIVSILYSGDYLGNVLEEYSVEGDGTSLLPNGDFKINFGDIKFSFSSLEG